MKNANLAAAVVDDAGQITLPPALCQQLGWERGRHLLAFHGSHAEAVVTLAVSSYLLLVEPRTLYEAIWETQDAVQ